MTATMTEDMLKQLASILQSIRIELDTLASRIELLEEEQRMQDRTLH